MERQDLLNRWALLKIAYNLSNRGEASAHQEIRKPTGEAECRYCQQEPDE